METNPFRAFIEMWSRTFECSGRTRRATYWGAICITLLISAILGVFLPYVDLAYSILSAIPVLTMSIRRLHDINLRGWWLLLLLIPFGGIVVLVLLLMDSTGANRFGDSPKYGPVPF